MSDLDDDELRATRILNGVEKTADKMFEELGYKKFHENRVDVRYSNSSNEIIAFYGAVKTFDKNTYPINMQELKAINKKCEELGWKE